MTDSMFRDVNESLDRVELHLEEARIRLTIWLAASVLGSAVLSFLIAKFTC